MKIGTRQEGSEWVILDDKGEELGKTLNGGTLLSLCHKGIKDISALAKLTNLRELCLDYNEITDFSLLNGLIKDKIIGNKIIRSKLEVYGMNCQRVKEEEK